MNATCCFLLWDTHVSDVITFTIFFLYLLQEPQKNLSEQIIEEFEIFSQKRDPFVRLVNRGRAVLVTQLSFKNDKPH